MKRGVELLLRTVYLHLTVEEGWILNSCCIGNNLVNTNDFHPVSFISCSRVDALLTRSSWRHVEEIAACELTAAGQNEPLREDGT